MNTPAQIARHIREVLTGGNWTSVNYKDTLADVSWQEAVTQVYDFNTIATLLHHTHYYIPVVTRVLQDGPLQGKDSESFSHPPVASQADWERLQERCRTEAEAFAALVEGLPEDQLSKDFVDPKYGNYYRHLHGFIEHLHYHLGQIVLIKKIIRQPAAQKSPESKAAVAEQ